MTAKQTGYAAVNGLDMYYEIHGDGEPLVLLHGGPTTIDTSFGTTLPTFARTRQVIAIEQQGHGHTADIDRPMSFMQMSDDTAALLASLDLEQVDVLGYSDGANVALGVAIRHPHLVRKLVLASGIYRNAGLVDGILHNLAQIGPDDFGPLKDAYLAVAPRPEDWPRLVRKAMQMAIDFPGYQPEDLRSIRAKTLVLIADEDIMRPEHAVEMFQLIPDADLAILPDSDHGSYLEATSLFLAVVQRFLQKPL